MQFIDINAEFKHAVDLLENTYKNVFITGRAGTGKSTLLNYFCKFTKKKFVVIAPTGVAALNVGGQTIHSFFGFRPNVTLADIAKLPFESNSENIYKIVETIVIDEISMVRADLLDCVDAFLKLNGRKAEAPFGGIQVVFIGDLYQLPPVITGSDKALIAGLYETPYFYSAKVFEDLKMELVELTKVYRQRESTFIELLTNIRNNSVTDEELELLNTRVRPEKTNSFSEELGVYLTTTNRAAAQVNSERLAEIKKKLHRFSGTIEGEFDEKSLPASIHLKLKVSAQVMMVNNDAYGRWVNGTLGVVKSIKKDGDGNKFINVQLESGNKVDIYPHTWNIYHYYAENGTLCSEVVGTFTQYPLILAWAITIHKSQGKTFDNVIIDIGDGTFACGQIYVALSRCRRLEGIILKKAITKKHIWTDYRVVNFLTKYQYKKAEEKISNSQKTEIIKKAIENRLLLEIVYLKPDDKKSRRIIKPLAISEMEYCGRKYLGFQAFCTLRNEKRVFKIERILEIKEIEEGAN